MKTLNQKVQRNLITFALGALIAAGGLMVHTSPVSANSCDAACNQYVTCTGEIFGRAPTPKEKKTLKAGCMKTCKKKINTDKIIACYTKSTNSCTSYMACIKKNYK